MHLFTFQIIASSLCCFFSKQRRWLMRFYETEIMQVLETGTNMDQGWEEVVAASM